MKKKLVLAGIAVVAMLALGSVIAWAATGSMHRSGSPAATQTGPTQIGSMHRGLKGVDRQQLLDACLEAMKDGHMMDADDIGGTMMDADDMGGNMMDPDDMGGHMGVQTGGAGMGGMMGGAGR